MIAELAFNERLFKVIFQFFIDKHGRGFQVRQKCCQKTLETQTKTETLPIFRQDLTDRKFDVQTVHQKANCAWCRGGGDNRPDHTILGQGTPDATRPRQITHRHQKL